MNNIPYGFRTREDLKKDTRVRTFLDPVRIVASENLIYGENLLLHREEQITLENSNAAILKDKGYFILDFGCEIHGNIKILLWYIQGTKTDGLKTARLRIRFGESVSETCSELGVKNSTNDHANRDLILVAGSLSGNEIGPTGFRFVRLDLLDEGVELSLKAIKGIAVYREIEYKGSFNCNDERVNKIWNTGAYTAHLNMQEYLWDGIKRDRLVWIGDMHPETSTINAVFGYNQSVPESMDLARNSAPLPQWMNTITTYSIWWILLQYDFFMHNGDKEYLKQQKDYLLELLTLLQKYINEDGSECLPERRFFDWPSNEDIQAKHIGLQAMMLFAMKYGASLCGFLGEKEAAEQCRQSYSKLQKYKPTLTENKQAAALMVLAEAANAKEVNANILMKDGSRRLSTFLGYYVLQAMAKAGNMEGALKTIKEYWGAMLDMGATTFWEDFNLDWLENAAPIDEMVPEGKKDLHGDCGAYCYEGFRHSLCHGWASGPTAFLSQYVLGISPAAPGFTEVKICPQLGGLEWAEGTYPTPKGNIWVKHTRLKDGTISTQYNLPEGVRLVK